MERVYGRGWFNFSAFSCSQNFIAVMNSLLIALFLGSASKSLSGHVIACSVFIYCHLF